NLVLADDDAIPGEDQHSGRLKIVDTLCRSKEARYLPLKGVDGIARQTGTVREGVPRQTAELVVNNLRALGLQQGHRDFESHRLIVANQQFGNPSAQGGDGFGGDQRVVNNLTMAAILVELDRPSRGSSFALAWHVDQDAVCNAAELRP